MNQVIVVQVMKGIEELVEDLPFQSYFGISLLRC